MLVPRPKPAQPTTLLEVDLGDTALVVREHADGLLTIEVNDERLIVNADQFHTVVTGFVAIGRAKGWIAEADGS